MLCGQPDHWHAGELAFHWLWWLIISTVNLTGFRVVWKHTSGCVNSVFPGKSDWIWMEHDPEYGQHHPLGWGTDMNTKNKSKLGTNVFISLLPDTTWSTVLCSISYASCLRTWTELAIHAQKKKFSSLRLKNSWLWGNFPFLTICPAVWVCDIRTIHFSIRHWQRALVERDIAHRAWGQLVSSKFPTFCVLVLSIIPQ